MRLRTIYFLVMMIALSIKVDGQNHFFRQYSNAEGFPNSYVYDLNQDDKGYLWIGTPDGLFRFNGFEFEQLSIEDGLSSNFVTKIFKDQHGWVWIGHQDGSISIWVENQFTILDTQSEAPGMVVDFAEDGKGSIWVSIQNQGLALIDKDLNIKLIDSSFKEEVITQIEPLGKNKYIIGTQENIYFALFNSAESVMETIGHFESYPGSKVVEIFPNSQAGFMIVSQEDGLFQLLPDSLSESYVLEVIDENLDGALDNLQGGLEDNNGSLWLSSMGYGLIQYRSTPNNQYSRTERITTDNGLTSDNIRVMFEDLEGNLWFGLYGDGLLKYVDNNLKHYNYSAGNQPEGTYAMTGDSEDFLLVSGNRLLWVDPSAGTVLKTKILPERSIGDRVSSVFLDNQGSIWLGYEQSGLYTLNSQNKQLKSVFISSDPLANSINHINGQGEKIWVSTKKGVFQIDRNSGATKHFTTNEGLPHNNIKQTYIDSKSRVLIATLCSNIHYIDNHNQVKILENSAIGPFNPVVSFIEDHQGALWAGTHGNGLWWIDQDSLKNFTSVSGLLSDFCYSLAITNKGETVIGHSGGISVVNQESLFIKTYGKLEGIKATSDFYTNAVHLDPLANVWFGTSDGPVKYSERKSKGELIPPLIQINEVRINGENVDFTKPILLKPGRYELQVNYIGLHYTNPGMVFYQTKLSGISKEWSDPTFSRSKVYDRLEHGTYSFELKAYNENEVFSVLSPGFELKIKKPLFRSLWFNALVVLAVIILIFVLLKMQERAHKMVQERLMNNLNEKSKEIIVKEEIIKERKKVEKVLIEAKTKAELSEKLKTSFLQNMSHEIRTPMNAIVGFSSLLSEEGIPDESKKEFVQNVNTNAASLLKLIDDILDLSKLETNQLEIKQEECLINPLINELELLYLEKIKSAGKERIKIQKVCPGEEDLLLLTDCSRLKQILDSLLDNALKFTESGSITFGYKVEDTHILFFVEDTGIGLSEDKKDVVFDLFRKVEDDRFKLYGGTGLGLTLAKYLVNLMGGSIDLESKQDFGSRFYFNIPLKSWNEINTDSNFTDDES